MLLVVSIRKVREGSEVSPRTHDLLVSIFCYHAHRDAGFLVHARPNGRETGAGTEKLLRLGKKFGLAA